MKLLILVVLAALTAVISAQSPYASLQIPKQIQYQGRVATAAGGTWSGTEGYFTFALVQGATFLWNNWDGNSNPATALTAYTNPQSANVLTLPVNQGVFSVRLGDTTLSSTANKEIPATVFFDAAVSNAVRANVKLAVWFSPDGGTFTRLSPDVDFTSVPFAMVAGIAETVKERAVTTAMLADGAVTSVKLADGSVTLAKIEPGGGTVPPGTIIPYGIPGSALPDGYVECNGTEVNAVDYPRLASLLGQGSSSAYGAAGAGKVRVPDFRGRVPMGQGQGSGLSSRILGETPGAETHTLLVTEMPPHKHNVKDKGHAHNYTTGERRRVDAGTSWDCQDDVVFSGNRPTIGASADIVEDIMGGVGDPAVTAPHPIIQPSLVVRYLMKY